jgi:4-diphosphocytidyl-2-C-methyl-D-erythritol kinase
MSALAAPAKLNLSLVIGPARADGKHEVATVLERLDLADVVTLEARVGLRVTGFREDTLVARALARLAEAAGVEPCWSAHIDKHIPLAAGLGGGSADAAAALLLANATLECPLEAETLHALARELGADVPFFLEPGPQLGTGDGTDLLPLHLPRDYWVVVVLPAGEVKESTASVYAAFDARRGYVGFDDRRASLLAALERVRHPIDLATLPSNDLVSSPFADELRDLGAFRADVSGAGPVVYGLFEHENTAIAAEGALRSRGRVWRARPAWYG